MKYRIFCKSLCGKAGYIVGPADMPAEFDFPDHEGMEDRLDEFADEWTRQYGCRPVEISARYEKQQGARPPECV